MSTPVYISPRVIDTVTSLPIEDRIPISNALSMEFILGIDPTDTLTPMQGMLYLCHDKILRHTRHRAQPRRHLIGRPLVIRAIPLRPRLTDPCRHTPRSGSLSPGRPPYGAHM